MFRSSLVGLTTRNQPVRLTGVNSNLRHGSSFISRQNHRSLNTLNHIEVVSLPTEKKEEEVEHTILASASDPNETIEAVEKAFSIISPVQESLLQYHSFLGQPWWVTFVTATIGLRICMLPVSYLGRRAVAKMFTEETAKRSAQVQQFYNREMMKLQRKLRSNRSKPVPARQQLEILGEATKLMRDRVRAQLHVWKLSGVNPLKIMVTPVTQLTIFIIYVISIRQMIRSGDLDLTEEGTLWFKNLQEPDPYYLLPIIATVSSYTSLEFALKGKQKKISSSPGDFPQRAVIPQQQPLASSSKRVTQPVLGPEKPRRRPDESRSYSSSRKQEMPVNESKSFGFYLGNGLQYLILCSLPMTTGFPSAIFMYWIPSSTFALASIIVRNQFNKRAEEKAQRKKAT